MKLGRNTLHDVDNHDVATVNIHLATSHTCNSRMAWFKNKTFFLLWCASYLLPSHFHHSSCSVARHLLSWNCFYIFTSDSVRSYRSHSLQGGVTSALVINDRGVTHAGESFTPLTTAVGWQLKKMWQFVIKYDSWRQTDEVKGDIYACVWFAYLCTVTNLWLLL